MFLADKTKHSVLYSDSRSVRGGISNNIIGKIINIKYAHAGKNNANEFKYQILYKALTSKRVMCIYIM